MFTDENLRRLVVRKVRTLAQQDTECWAISGKLLQNTQQLRVAYFAMQAARILRRELEIPKRGPLGIRGFPVPSRIGANAERTHKRFLSVSEDFFCGSFVLLSRYTPNKEELRLFHGR